ERSIAYRRFVTRRTTKAGSAPRRSVRHGGRIHVGTDQTRHFFITLRDFRNQVSNVNQDCMSRATVSCTNLAALLCTRLANLSVRHTVIPALCRDMFEDTAIDIIATAHAGVPRGWLGRRGASGLRASHLLNTERCKHGRDVGWPYAPDGCLTQQLRHRG